MSRVGWVFVGLIVLVAAAFLSMTSFGVRSVTPAKSAPSATADVATVNGPVGLLVVPVEGVRRGAIRDSWGDARGGGTRGHHGTDIVAPAGSRVVAAAPGRVEKLFESRLGGTTVYVRSPDRRWIYYYAHLAGYVPGLREGQEVRGGQAIAFVGDTGDAGAGNYHLHFGLQRMRPDERWWQGEDVNPYPLLAGRPVAR